MFSHLSFIVLTILFSAYAQHSLAYQYYGEQITDDSYYEIDKKPYQLNQTQQDQLDDIIEALDGQWRGELNLIECKGTVKSPFKIIDSSVAKLKIKIHNRKRLTLHADLDFRQQDKKVLYNRKIFDRRYLDSFYLQWTQYLNNYRKKLSATSIFTRYDIN